MGEIPQLSGFDRVSQLIAKLEKTREFAKPGGFNRVLRPIVKPESRDHNWGDSLPLFLALAPRRSSLSFEVVPPVELFHMLEAYGGCGLGSGGVVDEGFRPRTQRPGLNQNLLKWEKIIMRLEFLGLSLSCLYKWKI
ncbi:hypothetical protein Fot_15363 [Forsythia ovata]|uniref:Uncharacterized protein n=1 Tax=Forsythia ovata TaxID=205694 RepID=A0ABD1W9G1_9LAMI